MTDQDDLIKAAKVLAIALGAEIQEIARRANLRCGGCPGCSSFDCSAVSLLLTAIRERDAARAEAAQRAKELEATEKIVEHIEALTTEMGRPNGHDITDWMRAAVGDRNEFAAQQFDRMAADYVGKAWLQEDIEIRATKLRKAAPAAAIASAPEPEDQPTELIRQGHEALNADAIRPAIRSSLMAVAALVREVRR